MRWRRVCFVLAGSLLLLELGLRAGPDLGHPPRVMLDDEVEYRLIPNESYHRFGNRIEINRHGMRGVDHDARAQPRERRVLLIGDSVIYGNHFLDQSETIAARLTEYLETDPRFAGCTPIVMPAAASSWGPVNQTAFLQKTGVLDADVAIQVLSAHDLYDTPDENTPLIPYRLRRSYGALDDGAQMVVERAKRRFLPEPENTTPRPVRRAETLAAMTALSDQLKADGVPLILLYHPTTTERRNGLHPAHLEFSNWARAHEAEFGILQGDRLNRPEMYRDNIHPAAAGADVIAHSLHRIASPYLSGC